jgi:type IV secretory pathway VirB2 component (pilin)
MLAVLRPDSWNLPLFLHVLGATLTFGAVITVAVLGFAGLRGDPERALWLRRLAFWIGLVVLVPSFLLMRVAAGWIADKEYPDKTPGWVDTGFIVTEPGAVLVLVMLILAWFASRRAGSRVAVAVPWLAMIYIVALGIAWFAMSAKPGS